MNSAARGPDTFLLRHIICQGCGCSVLHRIVGLGKDGGRNSQSKKTDEQFFLLITVTKISSLVIQFAVFFSSDTQVFNSPSCCFSQKGSWETILNGWASSTAASRGLFFSGWKCNLKWPFHLGLAQFLSFLLHYLSCFSQIHCAQGYSLPKEARCRSSQPSQF